MGHGGGGGHPCIKHLPFFGRSLPAGSVVVFAGLLSILGVTPFLYLPLASMTTPPSNWGYARTVEGFFHLLGHGQFELLNPTTSIIRLILQLKLYCLIALKQYGLIFLLPALVPFCFLRRMHRQDRGNVFGFLAFYLCTSVLMTILLNPPPDRAAQGLLDQYYPPSYVILSTWTGFGLILLGSIIGKDRKKPVSPTESSAIFGDPGI
jgi:hypothetical protein